MAEETKTATTSARVRKPKEPEAPKEPKEPKEPEAPKEPKEPEEPEAPKEPKEPEAPKEPKEPEAPKEYSFCEAMALAAKGAKLRRREWDKVGVAAVDHIIIRRGETLPMMTNERYEATYTPSISDALANDWYEINEGENNA